MSDTDDAKRLFFEGLAYFESQNFSAAEARFIDTLKLAPRSIPTLNNLAIAQYKQNKIDRAALTSKRVLEIDANNVDALSVWATCQRQQKLFMQTLATYDKIISINPALADAHCNRGSVLNELRKYEEALLSFDGAIAIEPDFSDAHLNRGIALRNLRRYDEALAAYDKALTFNPDLAEALLGRGNVFAEVKRYNDAFADHEKALALKPELAEAWLGRGKIFAELKRYDDAFGAYDKALALKPDLAEAWLGRGNIFNELKRHDDAFAAFDKALALKPDLAEAWLGRGNVLAELKCHDDAFAAYDKALTLMPDLAEAWLGRGIVFTELKHCDDAFAAYDKALALKPDLAKAWLGRGNVFAELKRHDDAIAAYDKALALKPDLAEAWLGRGNAFTRLERYEDAFAAYDHALAIEADLDNVEGARFHTKMHLCDWSNFDAECTHLISSIKTGAATSPFGVLELPLSPEERLKCARLYSERNYRPADEPIWQGDRYNHDKIRIAYISADFRQHPASYLIAGLIETHNKEHFEVTGISLQPEDPSEPGQRMKRAFETFIDASKMSDEKIAHLVRELEVDITIDLMGFTQNARTNIFAQRPAPVQVNYLGFPGTMGATYIDYIIADQIVIPIHQQDFYSEKIVYMPNSFQANDRERSISKKVFTRQELGLPPNGVVFCCFNNNYKITPDVFDVWMGVLNRVADSVLWLVANNKAVENNLRREAAARNVKAERLVFAPRIPYYDYLARLSLADLFLDTEPFNAGTTASDALWAGLPVLTRVGDGFAGRMAASLLNAIGLPELITSTAHAYEDLAIELATSPEKLGAIKHKLAINRLRTPLFDTQLFTRHIEAAYTAMNERYQANLPPDHIYVPQ